LLRARDQLVALERARWLAELAQAVAQAQKVVWSLGVVDGDNEEARELYARLEAVLSEVNALRFGTWTRREVDAGWVESFIPTDLAISAPPES
jgi:hypothetical protein